MIEKLAIAAFAAALPVFGGHAPPREPPGWTSANLVANGSAEHGPAAGSESHVVQPAGWVTIGSFTAVRYGVEGLPSTLTGAAIGGGKHLFAGGPANQRSSAIQVADIPARWLPLVREGRAYAKLFASLGGWQTRPDEARVTVRFLDANGTVWGNALRLAPVTVAQRQHITAFLPVSVTGKVPSQTRYLRIRIDAIGSPGPYNTGLADNVALYLVR